MDHVEHKEVSGRRKAQVTGGLQQALGRARSTQGVQSQPSTSGLQHSSLAFLPIILDTSSGYQSPAQSQNLAPATTNPTPSQAYPHALLSPDPLQQLSLPSQLPGANPSRPAIPPVPEPPTIQHLGSTTPSFFNELQPHRAAPPLNPTANQLGPSRFGGGEHCLLSASGLASLRGCLAAGHMSTKSANPASQVSGAQTAATATVDSISASGAATYGQDVGSNTGGGNTSTWPVRASRPVPKALPVPDVTPQSTLSYGGSYTAGGLAMTAPPAVTPLSSSFSQGYPQGLPSWLLLSQEEQRQEPRGQRPATLSSHISTTHITYQAQDSAAGLSVAPQSQPQLQHSPRPSPFLTAHQRSCSAQSSTPQTSSNIVSLQPQRQIHQQQQQPNGAAAPATGAGYARGPMAQASWGGSASSFGEREALSRSITTGRMSMPRVPSISEIEPVLESDDLRLRTGSLGSSSSSLLTRAIRSPSTSQPGDRPRTYRVAPVKSQGSHDDVTVVLEGVDDGGGGGAVSSVQAVRGAGSAQGSHHSLGSSGGAGALLSTSLLPSSLLTAPFLGGIFSSRQCVTPDSSVHGADALPFGGRERYFSGAATDPPRPPAFGSLPTSSLLRSRAANASVGSILSKATGGLNTPLKRATSYQQFSLVMDGSGGAGRGGQPVHSSVNGGSESSGTGTSTGLVASGVAAAAGGRASSGGYGLGAWLRGAGASSSSRSLALGAGQDGSESEVASAGRRGEPDLADLAVLASSLPASLGTWSLPRSVALASSPSPHCLASSLLRTFSRADSLGSAGGGGGAAGPSSSSAPAAAVGPAPYPICLICLEVLTPEDFETGDAMALQCACKGEVALRHRKCAIEWSHHKGDVVCDICKQIIANLPPIPTEVLAAREAARRRRQPAFNTASEPNFADYVFDCIRATWVTMIVCVLFFDLTVGQAFMAGTVVGVAFAMVSAILAACARRARARLATRAVERAAAESRAQEQQQTQRRQQVASGGSDSLTQPLLAAAGEA